ncbi:MAG TPA: asparagine synthase (glutamine-hydrolyzing) [Bryobacterales bacterium]|nr:asparagine synthase (glutamine-hydrolyzing) [Bryobacterales bacterium]
MKGRSYTFLGKPDMCGITGYLACNSAAPDRSIVERMCERLSHRGPDSSGFFCDQHAALGHRRLSIIDRRGGNQPLSNEDGSIQVVFNGEIYNFQALRRKLIEKGHKFATNSDTEVLVHLYEDAGERMPELLNGMFAFAIWDQKNQQMFLARDRLGEKPLYYSFSVPGVRFCFASELKALTAVPGFDAPVSGRSVCDFLAFSYIPDPQTIYRNVFKLEPGSSLTVNCASYHIRRYWEPAFLADRRLRFDDAVEALRDLAVDSVKCRLISEAPLGAFLSGGVDSSAVAGILARETGQRPKTFSIGFTSPKFDERAFARLMAGRCHTEHHEYVVSPEAHDAIEAVTRHFDEPFGDPSAIPTLHLARVTRQDVTVALGGDGADELFGGYRRYLFGVIEDRLRAAWPGWFRRSVIGLGAQYYPKFDYLPRIFRAKTLLANLSQEIGHAYFTSMSVFRDRELDCVLSSGLRRELRSYSPRDSFSARFAAVRHLSPLEQMQAVDLETYLPGDILVKLDRATMAHSLEARSPWLDYRLAELAFRLPSHFKIRGTRGKVVFKEAVAPFVPREILTRRKMGFSPPLAAWFRSSLAPAFRALVFRPEMEEYVNLPEVRRLWDEHQSRTWNHDRKLWNLLMLAGWDVHRQKSPVAELVEAAV